MDVVYARCAGLDVHKETVVACVRVILGGKTTREVKTFETTTSGLLMLLAWLMEQGCTHVAMEATGVYWKPVWHILSDGGFELVLANAAHIKNVPGRKTDVCDASWIADLLAYGLIRASFVPCLSGCHPQPLAVVFGHAHGRSPAWQSSVPTIAPRVPATFSRRRGLRRLPGEGSLERRVCLPPLSGGGRAVPLRKSSWRLALPQVPP